MSAKKGAWLKICDEGDGVLSFRESIERRSMESSKAMPPEEEARAENEKRLE